MPGTTVIGSGNISLLDLSVKADLCSGVFKLDISPSVFIGSGANNVLGIKVKVVNPFNSTIKDYGAGYDGGPGMSGGVIFPVSVNVPTRAGKYQYGLYSFHVELTDADGKKYYADKSQNICEFPDQVKVCTASVQIIANCQAGKLTILTAEPPNYQGKQYKSKTQNYTLYYPTASGLTSINSGVANFSVPIFEGVYEVVGTRCVLYDMGDNVSVSVPFAGTWTKDVKCVLDYSCIYPQIKKLVDQVNGDCSSAEREELASVVLNALMLFKTIEITLAAGEDAGDQIAQLETLLGCSCTCDCTASSAIVNGAPATDVVVTGCNVTKETIGLTDHYTIDNFDFLITADPAQSIISVSAPSLTNCVKTQQISFNAPQIYQSFTDQINSAAQYAFWGQVINNYLVSVDPTCIGLTANQWGQLSLAGKIQAMIAHSCVGGSCTASVAVTTSHSGADVTLGLTITNGYTADIFVDNILQGTVLAAATSFKLKGFADGHDHLFLVIPRCNNGNVGIPYNSDFQFIGCPDIQPLSIPSNNVTNATCPYNLNSTVAALPSGITAEWHTANNTDAATLVGNPAAVNTGIYFGFAKNASGCYSVLSTQLTLQCAVATSCTAPQNLTATSGSGSSIIVQFDNPLYPPPANSFTVKRRLASDPDVSGSYVTLPTPAFNSSTGKWQTSDTVAPFSAVVYRAISNCGATTPSIDANFSYGVCDTLSTVISATQIIATVTAASSLGYPSHQVRISLYDASGAILLQQQTVIPSGGGYTASVTFLYLAANTLYRIKTENFLNGTKLGDCSNIQVSTAVGDNFFVFNATSGITLNTVKIAGSDFSTVTGGAYPMGPGSNLTGKFSSSGGLLILNTSGTSAAIACLYVNGVLLTSMDVSSPGDHAFVNSYYSSGDQLTLRLSNGGTCP